MFLVGQCWPRTIPFLISRLYIELCGRLILLFAGWTPPHPLLCDVRGELRGGQERQPYRPSSTEFTNIYSNTRGGSRNSSRGGGFWAGILRGGGGGG